MKKYVKPELFFESFELSQSIAACGIDVNYADEHACAPTTDPDFWSFKVNVFSDENGNCAQSAEKLEGYCYTYGTNEAGRLFNS